MPAIVTHHLFGEDLLATHPTWAQTPSERDAFLLGCQGPDPLFYLRVHPLGNLWKPLGTIMHTERTPALLAALEPIVNQLESAAPAGAQDSDLNHPEASEGTGISSDAPNPQESDAAIGRAFARGFLAHYALDSRVHPLVYAQQYALCNAGVPGLDARAGSEVHGVIETTIDEAQLFAKTGCTVNGWLPYEHILQASQRVVRVASRMCAYAAASVYRLEPPESLYASAVTSFRTVQRAFNAPEAVRVIATRTERLVKPHSLVDAMSHRVNALVECDFDNHEHTVWTNPFTKEQSTASFAELTEQATKAVEELVAAFDARTLDESMARQITGGIDFNGEPLAAAV